MFEPIVKKIVDHQIDSGTLSEADRGVYLYGYQMLIEFCINIITSIIIAAIFQAYWIVLVFTAAFLVIRGYVGGYHARTSLGCFCLSACMLIAAIIAVKYINNGGMAGWALLTEIIMLPCIFKRAPIPAANKPITENERIHFNKKVKQLYIAELIIEFFLWLLGLNDCALSVLAVHAVLFIMVVADWFFDHKK